MALIITAPQISTRADYMTHGDRKRCGDTSHSESTSRHGGQAVRNLQRAYLLHQALGVRTPPRVAFGLHHRFPTRLESVMFSTSVSIGRAKANATASATCVTLIIRSRGHLPSTWLQISVSVAGGVTLINAH